jgi:hypothetical protein
MFGIVSKRLSHGRVRWVSILCPVEDCCIINPSSLLCNLSPFSPVSNMVCHCAELFRSRAFPVLEAYVFVGCALYCSFDVPVYFFKLAFSSVVPFLFLDLK